MTHEYFSPSRSCERALPALRYVCSEGANGMYLHANGTRLFFDVVGSGLRPREAAMQPKPTLLVLHGGPGLDHSYFRPNLDPLSEDAQVLYLDLRGQGRSTRHRNEYYQVGIMADDVVAFCTELAIEKPIVL